MLIISVDKFSFPSGAACSKRCVRMAACEPDKCRLAGAGHTSRCTVLAGLCLSCSLALSAVRPRVHALRFVAVAAA
jgi:hypothetical protein